MKVYTYNDKVLVNSANDKWLKEKEGPEPIVLPDWTIRIKLAPGSSTPSIGGATVTPVEGQADVYDVCTVGWRGTTWGSMFSSNTSIIEVIEANLSSTNGNVTSIGSLVSGATNLVKFHISDLSTVTNASQLFGGCTSLTDVYLGNTSNFQDISSMFSSCSSLTVLPDFDVSSVNNCQASFMYCSNVESGALSMYQKLSALSPLPSYNGGTFVGCGANTVTGAAELAQIPSSWGGGAS